MGLVSSICNAMVLADFEVDRSLPFWLSSEVIDERKKKKNGMLSCLVLINMY